MYYLGVKSDFSAAHFLKDYNGKCSNLHGHNWIVEAVFRSDTLDEIHMSVDFGVIRKILKEVLEEMDHVLLNDIEIFRTTNPTAEVISRYIYEKIRNRVKDQEFEVYEVKVWESLNSWVKWKED